MRWLIVLLLLLVSSAAQAQTTTRCGAFDTNNSNTTPFPALGTCNVTTGPNGIIFATANSEEGCNGTAAVQLLVGAGTTPITGSNFAGNIATAGQLTVTSLVNGFGYGEILGLSITTAGTPASGTPGTYVNVATTGGSGTLGHVNVTVGAGGNVTTVSPNNGISNFSIGYHVGDVLSVASGLIGGTTGFTTTVTSILASSPWIIQNGQTLTALGYSKQTATITGQLSSSLPGGDLGMLGVYTISDATVTGSDSAGYTLPALPGGLTAISPVLHTNACGPGYVTTSVAGSYIGTPNSNYYLLMSINTDVNGNVIKWNNSGIQVLTW